MITTWSAFDTARLAAEKFWPSEATLDLMLRDWAITETPVDWVMKAVSTPDAVWTTVAYIGLVLPSWSLDSGFGSYGLTLTLTLSGKVAAAPDILHVRLGTVGTAQTYGSASYVAKQVTATIPYTTLPTGLTQIEVQAYVTDNGGGGGGNVKSDVGDGADSWRISIT